MRIAIFSWFNFTFFHSRSSIAGTPNIVCILSILNQMTKCSFSFSWTTIQLQWKSEKLYLLCFIFWSKLNLFSLFYGASHLFIEYLLPYIDPRLWFAVHHYRLVCIYFRVYHRCLHTPQRPDIYDGKIAINDGLVSSFYGNLSNYCHTLPITRNER